MVKPLIDSIAEHMAVEHSRGAYKRDWHDIYLGIRGFIETKVQTNLSHSKALT